MAEIAREKSSSRRGPQARGEETRRLILDCALTLIARRGAGSFSVREVAAAAGVSPGLLTYHFRTRAALLTAAFELHLQRADEQGLALGDTHGAAIIAGELGLDPMTDIAMKMLRQMVHAERDVFIAGQELTLEITRDPKLAETVRPALSNHRHVIETLLSAVGSPAPSLDAEIFSAAFEGFGLKWVVHPDEPEFEARLRAAMRRLLQKFLVPPHD